MLQGGQASTCCQCRTLPWPQVPVLCPCHPLHPAAALDLHTFPSHLGTREAASPPLRGRVWTPEQEHCCPSGCRGHGDKGSGFGTRAGVLLWLLSPLGRAALANGTSCLPQSLSSRPALGAMALPLPAAAGVTRWEGSCDGSTKILGLLPVSSGRRVGCGQNIQGASGQGCAVHHFQAPRVDCYPPAPPSVWAVAGPSCDTGAQYLGRVTLSQTSTWCSFVMCVGAARPPPQEAALCLKPPWSQLTFSPVLPQSVAALPGSLGSLGCALLG